MMATVLNDPIVTGELDLFFQSATISGTIEAPLSSFVGVSVLADPRELLSIDLDSLVSLWGPLQKLSWVVEISPQVVPLPASVWLLMGAVAVAGWFGRRAQ